MAVQTLTSAFSGLSVQDDSGHRSASHAPKVADRSGANLPAPGTVLTVKHMTPEQENGIRRTLQTIAEQERIKAEAERGKAEAEREKAASLEQVRRAQAAKQSLRTDIDATQARIAENQENLKVEREKYAAETQKIGLLCQAVAAKFQNIRPLNLSDPTALGKIDAYLRTVDAFKRNIPNDSNQCQAQIKKLQADAQVVLASVRTK